jgi:phage/plasmid-like protein (TIGR03299 family)
MAHNLATINGRIAMAYQGVAPWHELGIRMSGTADVQTALTAANLDWRVNLESVFLQDGRQVPDRFATIREGDRAILGTVGPSYTPLWNADAFGVLDGACRDHGVTIESAGALGNGSRVWMLAKMQGTIEPVAGDRINGYFLINTGHDGTLAYGARLTPIRVVCQNTLNAALSNGKDWISIRHTKSSTDKIVEAGRMISQLTAALAATGKTYGDLAHRTLTPAEIAQYIESVIPTPENEPPTATIRGRRDQIAALVFAGVGSDLANQDCRPGTASAWSAYNAVCEYWDHVRPAEAKSVSARQAANESAIFGGNAQIKIKALQVARQLVAA